MQEISATEQGIVKPPEDMESRSGRVRVRQPESTNVFSRDGIPVVEADARYLHAANG